MVAQADNVEFIIVENESESLYLESNLIKQHLPPFNNMLK
jgi:excinuclease ABC subunit C